MRRAILVPAGAGTLIGIWFRPGGAARVLPTAPCELTGLDARLGALWPADAVRLAGALGTRVDTEENGRALHGDEPDGRSLEALLARAGPVLEAALLRRLASHGEASDARVRAAVDLLSRRTSVHAAARSVELSERH